MSKSEAFLGSMTLTMELAGSRYAHMRGPQRWESMRLDAMINHGMLLGEALRAIFAIEFGLKPMEDPRTDCRFLDGLDSVCRSFSSQALEDAFYAAGE